uniref:BZIP domain-containing protein n=1 Tax=Scleropages formosus TaxID=113540 RepID=A0A8C9RNH5_SCLFO
RSVTSDMCEDPQDQGERTGWVLQPSQVSCSFSDEAVSILTCRSLPAHSLLGCPCGPAGSRGAAAGGMLRQRREFTPDSKKNDSYWDKRRKNNEAAKQSRERRRVHDALLERRLLALLEENARLRAELLALKFRFGLVENTVDRAVQPTPAAPCNLLLRRPHCYGLCSDAGTLLTPPHVPPTQGGLYGRTGARDMGCIFDDSGFATSGSSSVGSPVILEDRLSEPGKLSLSHGENSGYESQPRSPEGERLAACKGGVGAYAVAEPSGEVAGRQDSGDSARCLPHKLRLKVTWSDGSSCRMGENPGEKRPSQHVGGRDVLPEPERPWLPYGGEEPGQGVWLCPRPSEPCYQSPRSSAISRRRLENSVLRHQLNCLSEDVAQLKWLFSQKLISKAD